MNNSFVQKIAVYSWVIMLLNCGSCSDPKPVSYDINEIKEQIEKDSKKNAHREKREIERYVKKNKWDALETGTGLSYRINNSGTGDLAQLDQIAFIHYSIYLLNDSMCYSSEGKEPAFFRIGMADVETGLHEGVQLMRIGDKAEFLMPSHLAHGTFGDQNKIPPQTPLRYEIELLSLK